MLVKDLIEHLETGNRVDKLLKVEPKVQMPAAVWWGNGLGNAAANQQMAALAQLQGLGRAGW